MRLGIGLLALSVAACSSDTQSEYMVRTERGFVTTHDLTYTFQADEGFTQHGPLHRRDEFNGVPYGISLAAYLSENTAVMIHAERVLDGSGASDYSSLAPSDWPDNRFRATEASCFTLSPDDTEGEHDLEWLSSEGFAPTGTLIFQQFFASTQDFNDEIVVSLLVRADNCDINLNEEITSAQSRLMISAS